MWSTSESLPFSRKSECCSRIHSSIHPSIHLISIGLLLLSEEVLFRWWFNPGWFFNFLFWQTTASLAYSPGRLPQSQVPDQGSTCLWELSLFSWGTFWETLAPNHRSPPKLPVGDEGKVVRCIFSFLTPLTLKAQTHVVCFFHISK